MSDPGKIRSNLFKIVAQALRKEELYLKIGTASDIDLLDHTFTFNPVDETAPVEKCQLQAKLSGAPGSALIVPADGSLVLVGFTSPTTGILLQADQADQILLETDNQIRIVSSQVMIKDGSFGGLIKINELTDQLQDLRNFVQDLRDEFAGHTHAGVTPGSGSTAPAVSTLPPAPQIVQAEYENENVVHG